MIPSQPISRRKRHGLFILALVLASVLFFLHAYLLIELGDVLAVVSVPLRSHYGALTTGKFLVLSSFIVLFIAHFAEAVAWGLFFWRAGLTRRFPDGVYFAVVSVTTVGYGDLVLPPPWRLLGPLAGINGTLMFGCSTAFLFLVLQNVWTTQT
jgi:hypothetical protein